MQGGDWRDAVDGLRPWTPQLWRSLSDQGKRTFVSLGDYLTSTPDPKPYKQTSQASMRLSHALSSLALIVEQGRAKLMTGTLVSDLVSSGAGKASWDFHRHRVAPEIHAVLQEQLDRRRFQVLAAQVQGLKVLESGKVQARLGGEDGPEDREFDYVINCTGPNAGTPPFSPPDSRLWRMTQAECRAQSW